jgi:hypothetical protein
MTDLAWYDLTTRAKKICVGLAVLAAACAFVTSARANEDELEIKCRGMLQRHVFNCGCTTEFLEQHFNAEQAEILLRLWVLAVNDERSNRELTVLYARHGQKTIDDTIMKFHAQRDRLRLYCAQGGAPDVTD